MINNEPDKSAPPIPMSVWEEGFSAVRAGLEDEIDGLRQQLKDAQVAHNAARVALAASTDSEIRLMRQRDEALRLLRQLENIRRSASASGHVYLSTACLHAKDPGREELHQFCQIDSIRYDGTHKVAAQCKWCPSPCVCECHREDTENKGA